MKLVSLVAAIGIVGAFATPPARARHRRDPRAAAVKRFWQCLRSRHCPVNRVFVGSKALLHWKRQDKKQRRYHVILRKATFVATMTDRGWKQRWARAVPILERAGYSAAALRRLGAGQSVVQASRNVALALTRNVIFTRQKTSTTVLFMVLWRTGRRWRVASWECNPKNATRFMIAHKPR